MSGLRNIFIAMLLIVSLPAGAAVIKSEHLGPVFHFQGYLNNLELEQPDWAGFLNPRPPRLQPVDVRHLERQLAQFRNHLPQQRIEVEPKPPATNVVEPPILGLMALGMLGMIGARRRVRQAAE